MLLDLLEQRHIFLGDTISHVTFNLYFFGFGSYWRWSKTVDM